MHVFGAVLLSALALLAVACLFSLAYCCVLVCVNVQYEDNVGAYFEQTRQLYKDCVTVAKNSTTQKLHITSQVYSIQHVVRACFVECVRVRVCVCVRERECVCVCVCVHVWVWLWVYM